MVIVFWVTEGYLVSGILEKGCHNQSRAVRTDVQEVKIMNSKCYAKQENVPHPHIPYRTDLSPSDLSLFGALWDEL